MDLPTDVNQYINSINLNYKIFALLFCFMSFILVMAFVGMIIYLNVKRCQYHLQEKCAEEKSKSFLFQQNLTIDRSSRRDTMVLARPKLTENLTKVKDTKISSRKEEKFNFSIVSEGLNHSIRNDVTIDDDIEFYEIRSDISTDFCADISKQNKWEAMIQKNIKNPPIKNGENGQSLPKNQFSRVRRCLLDEFNFADVSTF